MNIIKFFGILVFTLSIAGCANMTSTQQRTMTGGLGGAGLGAVIGAIAGNAGMGAAIGGLAGTAGGYLYGKHKESEQNAYDRGRSDQYNLQPRQPQYQYNQRPSGQYQQPNSQYQPPQQYR